jgi:hypothetical protein
MSFEYTLDADCQDGWFMEHTLEFMLCFLALGIAFFLGISWVLSVWFRRASIPNAFCYGFFPGGNSGFV